MGFLVQVHSLQNFYLGNNLFYIFCFSLFKTTDFHFRKHQMKAPISTFLNTEEIFGSPCKFKYMVFNLIIHIGISIKIILLSMQDTTSLF